MEKSKLDSLVLWEYLLLLWQSKFGNIISARFFSFCLIGGSGVFVHIIALYFFINFNFHFLYAQTLSTFVAMTSNFFFK